MLFGTHKVRAGSKLIFGPHRISAGGKLLFGTHRISAGGKLLFETHKISTGGKLLFRTHRIRAGGKLIFGPHKISAGSKLLFGTHRISAGGKLLFGTQKISAGGKPEAAPDVQLWSLHILPPIYSNCFLSFFQWQIEIITTLLKTCIIPMKNYVLYFAYEYVIHTFIVYTKLFKTLTKKLKFSENMAVKIK